MAKRNCVGVIGLGRMGNPVAQRFIGAKMPLMVWDVSEERRGPFEDTEGVTIVTPREIGESCAVVFFVVPSSSEIATCFRGKDGLLKNPRKGLVIYDLTTSDPAKTKRLARRAERAGLGYLDAGMSGGPGNILEGKLTLIIGGDEALLKRTRRYLKPFVDHTFHLGALGSGHTMKLIHNMVLHTTFLATCEGARLVERLGMRVEDMIDVFNASAAYSYASRHRFPNNILSGTWNGQARIYNLQKDVGLAVGIGRKRGADIQLAEHTLSFLRKAVERGMIEEDLTLLYRDFDQIQKMDPPE
ncbi:MAG: NAD(P)-dependent oxidoreductase [Nitrospinae bacterium]|nr:NAD(P)-dependent oxidoreductase [Nitrospinota bacterium]